MEELLAALAAAGYQPPNIALDGKMRRFGRNGSTDSAWFIGFQNHSVKLGKTYHVAVYGDWKTGEEHTYKPSGTMSREDQLVIKSQIEAARKAREEERKERAERARDKAGKLWLASDDKFEAAYYSNKLIDKPYGTRTFECDGGRAVVVPMRDIDGTVWGTQRIFPDGSKKFLSGQRVEGMFHLIGENVGDHLLVCEGFATATSLHQATGLSVVVAFNAGNLVPVSKALRKAYPDVAMTICGDDDRWTEGNPGKAKAVKAATVAQAVVIFPTFVELVERQTTDFNDLHAREGLESVKSHFAQATARETGFVPLGVEGMTDFYYSIELKDVIPITTYSPVQMYRLAHMDYWTEMHPSKNGVDWEGARHALIQLCKRIGQFDTGRIRGTGVWLDEGRVIVNTGHALLVNGRHVPMQGIKSWYVYIQTKRRMPPLHPDPLTAAECAPLIDACRALKWRTRDSGILLAGWLANARIAGALPIRPHIWLTGSSATGKSTVMNHIVAPCLGAPGGKTYAQGGTSEAGIRQDVKSSSVPVIFDELETTGSQSGDRVAAVVELLRQTWSHTHGSILKGSATGGSIHYQLSFAALVSSIRVSLENDADRSRFSILELAPHGSDPAEWEQLERLLEPLTEEFGERLFARACHMHPTIVESQKRLAKGLVKLGATGQRMAQQYGTLLAGYWSLMSDDPIPPEAVAGMVADLDFGEARKTAELTDDLECLNHLLTSRVTMRLGMTTVDKVIGRVIADRKPEEYDVLKNYGVIVSERGIMVANCHAELSRLYANTRWSKNWNGTMERIPGAKKDDRAYYGATRSRSLFIPFDVIPSSHCNPSDTLP